MSRPGRIRYLEETLAIGVMWAGKQREDKDQLKRHSKDSDLTELMFALLRLSTVMPRSSASAFTPADCCGACTSMHCGFHLAISLFVTVANNDDDDGNDGPRFHTSVQVR